MGLNTNTKKTEAMVFLPERVCTCLTAAIYKARMSNVYWEERRGRKVTCQECGVEITVGSLWSHLEALHSVYTSFVIHADAAPPVAPRQLPVVFNIREGKYRCPVRGCPQGAKGQGCKTPCNLRWDFGYRHPAMKW